MTGSLADAALRPVAALHRAALTSADGDGPVTTPRLPAREDAERELSKPRYHENDPNLLQRIIEWVWDRISSLLDAASGATPGGPTGLIAVIAVLVLLALALRLRLGKLRAQPTSDTSALFDNRPRTAADHRASSEAHASEARWSEAVQERMRALVRSLEERALLDPRPGRTADEAADEAGLALPEHADALQAAAHSFDEVTYADRPADEAAYLRLRDLDTALRRATPAAPANDREPAASRGGGRS
ncbi:DUF4129 domain-containing protein [Streptomyces albiaxialis]|uniref:DUF4129 domain-containing protein n=1 Tax=Streptomyces albiaxialis TaxID=329523 RepID=A0ABP5I138_9ACTN